MSLIHEAEERVKVNLIVLAAIDNLVHNLLEVIEDLNVGDVFLGHVMSVKLLRVLLDILRHIEEALQIPQRVVGLAFVDFAVKFTLACAISASGID